MVCEHGLIKLKSVIMTGRSGLKIDNRDVCWSASKRHAQSAFNFVVIILVF